MKQPIIALPDLSNKNVKKLLQKIASKHSPVYVPVRPEEYAAINFCTIAVERKTRLDGGNIVYGWQIWQTPLIVEAIFHAIWESPTGELMDITPQNPPTEQIMFIKDETLIYSGYQIDNIRINNTTNSLVYDIIAISEARYKIWNKGDRAKEYGAIELIGEEAVIYQYLEIMQNNLQQCIYNGGNRKTKCGCGSNIIYSDCHGKELKIALKKV